MQLQVTANPLAITSYQSLATAEQKQPPVTGTVAPVAAAPETLKTSPTSQPVSPSGAGAETEAFSEQRQRINRDPLEQEQQRSFTDQQEDDQEQQLIRELAARDREVRQHELNHAAAGGQYAGAPSYEFQRGPDGRLYAVGGEVSIDTSPVPNDPKATLEKAEVILRAALSVAEPSAQDRAVAARATALAAEARAELARNEGDTEQRRDAQGEADQIREERRSEELKDRIEDQLKRNEDTADRIQEFSEQLQEVNERFAEINQRLIDVGVFKKLFPEGLIFDQIV